MSDQDEGAGRLRRRVLGLVAGLLTAAFGCLLWAGPQTATPTVTRPISLIPALHPAVVVSLRGAADPTRTVAVTTTPLTVPTPILSAAPAPSASPVVAPSPSQSEQPTEVPAARRKP